MLLELFAELTESVNPNSDHPFAEQFLRFTGDQTAAASFTEVPFQILPASRHLSGTITLYSFTALFGCLFACSFAFQNSQAISLKAEYYQLSFLIVKNVNIGCKRRLEMLFKWIKR